MDKIQYQIKDKQLYIGDGGNKISQIKNKLVNKAWKACYAQEKLQLVFLFKEKSVVMQTQIKLINVRTFVVEFFDTNNKKRYSHFQNLNYKEDTIKISIKQCFQCSRASLTLNNDIIDPQQMGIRFIIFSGLVQKKNPKVNSSKKNMNEFTKEIQNKYQLKSQKLKKQQIFDKRNKTTKQNLLKLEEYYQHQAAISGNSGKRDRKSNSKQKQSQNNSQKKNTSKKVKKNHDDQSSEEVIPQKRSNRKSNKKTTQFQDQQNLDLAIAISKSQVEGKYINLQQEQIPQALIQYQKQANDKGLNKLTSQSYLDDFQKHFSNRIQYETMDYSKENLKQLQNVNQSWLQAQKQAQKQNQVQQHHKLSNYIKVKHLYLTPIFVTGFSEENNMELKKICKQLGAQILQGVKNHCLVITTKLQAQKLHKKHKQLKDVKYIHENYIHECLKYNRKLKPSDYYIKL